MAGHGLVSQLLLAFACFVVCISAGTLGGNIKEELQRRQTEGHKYLLGAGKGDITGPIVDVLFMGYADFNQKGTGLRQRLYSRAFIVGDVANPKDRIVYLVQDLQSGDVAVRDGILEGLQALGPDYAVYTKDNVAVTGTHSHSGPGGWTNYFLHHASTLGFNQAAYDAAVNGSIASIKRAHESLKEGTISVGTIRLEDANINRSPYSYLANPEEERKQYKDDVDKDLTLLRFADNDNKDIGVLSFFPTHGTSMLSNNTLVTGDNKGVAAYLFEKRLKSEVPGFVAGFSQANVGDVSPNVGGPWCESGPDAGKQCKLEDSTCGGSVAPCHARGPRWGLNDGGTQSCFEIGRRQYEAAYKLYEQLRAGQGAAVSGAVRAFHSYHNLEFANFPHPNGTNVTTCSSALGYSFAAGTTDGPGIADFKQGLKSPQPEVSPIWPILSGLIKTPTARNKACQGVKPILLDIGETTFPYQWGPNIVGVQALRIGSLVIVVSAGEATTMSGRRWKAAVAKAATSAGIANPTVLLGGPANSYIHYIATEEEYGVQRYEGAGTLFGPHTLNALIHYTVSHIPYLSTAPPSTALPAGPDPPINVKNALSLILPPAPDFAPIGKKFGDVLTQPKQQYKTGDVVNVTFVGANPRNNLRSGATYASVQKLVSSTAPPPSTQLPLDPQSKSKSKGKAKNRRRGAVAPRADTWTTVLDDADWELVFRWRTAGVLGTTSEATVTWEIGADALPGTYRVVYTGDAKSVAGGATAFTGTSAVFGVGT